MDVRLFSIDSFRNGNIATLIIGLGEFGIVAVLPLWLQFALGYSPVQAGLALVPVAIGSFVASGASFGLATKMSALGLVRLGLALEAVGLAGLGLVARPTARGGRSPSALFVYGIGVGFATAQVTNVVLADVPEQSAGQGSGVQSVFRQLGSALGIAVLTTTFFSLLSSTLRDDLATSGMPTAQADELTRGVTNSAGAAIDGLAAQPNTAFVADIARSAMTHGVTVGSYLAAGFLVAGAHRHPADPAHPGGARSGTVGIRRWKTSTRLTSAIPVAGAGAGDHGVRMTATEPTTDGSYRDRIVAVEPGGNEYIAEADRHGKPSQLFWTWTSPNLEFATIFVGVLAVAFYGMSFWQAVAGIVIGTGLGALAHYFLSARGPLHGVPQMVLGRLPFGFKGNAVPAVLMSVTAGVGWFATNSVSGAYALADTVRHRAAGRLW